MEWSKAKTIIIILLIILNVFLFISILYSNSSLSLNSDYVKYVRDLLDSKNVRLETDVPAYHADSGRIVYEDSVIDKSKVLQFIFGRADITPDSADSQGKTYTYGGKSLTIGNNTVVFTDSEPAKSMSIHNKTELVKELNTWFVGLGIDQNEYVADIFSEQGDSVYIKFIRKYKGQLLFDIYADFNISASGVQSMSIALRKPKNIIQEEEILSAYQVMVVGGVPDNSTITAITFGYKELQQGEINDSPAWRIRFSDGSEKFYNAYTGEMLADRQVK